MFYLFRLFYSFLPLHNPIGFGASDFIELALALLLVCAVLAWQRWADGAIVWLQKRSGAWPSWLRCP